MLAKIQKSCGVPSTASQSLNANQSNSTSIQQLTSKGACALTSKVVDGRLGGKDVHSQRQDLMSGSFWAGNTFSLFSWNAQALLIAMPSSFARNS
eukprot:5034612-Karenia_brevis.AAC.1